MSSGTLGIRSRGPGALGTSLMSLIGQQQELLDVGPGVDHDEQVGRQRGQQRLGDLPPLARVVAQGRRVAEGQLAEPEARRPGIWLP